MKKTLLLTVVLVLGATMAFAQNGSIGIFADNAGLNCNLPGAPGIANYYFVHVNAVGATGSQWAAPAPACFSAVRLADLAVFAVNLGNTTAGITIGYGICKTGTFHIMTALYQVLAAPTQCCRWTVVADPSLSSGKIEIPDCAFLLTYGTGGQGLVGTMCPTCNVPTEDTTWGQVKALYTE
jgi:hypothetical protein